MEEGELAAFELERPPPVVRHIPIYEWVETPKGAKGETLLHEVPHDRILEVARLEIYFPVGVEGMVEVRITADGIQQYPWRGVYKGDDVLLTSVAERFIGPGVTLLAEWENKDTVNDLAFSIHLSCVERVKL